MEITDELRKAVLSLWNEAQEQDMDAFVRLLKEKAESLDVSYYVLLKLVFDKEFLVLELAPKIEEIDREIRQLEKQLADLKHTKNILGSMICEMHGHTISDYDSFSNTQHCVMCGKEVQIDRTNDFLIKRRKLNDGFYPKD